MTDANDKLQKQYIEVARKKFECDDDNEIDEGQRVSLADGGAWVEIWHWISADELNESDSA